MGGQCSQGTDHRSLSSISGGSMSVIEEVVSKIDDWAGKEVSITTLSGGLTNTNYKITVDGKPYNAASSEGVTP